MIPTHAFLRETYQKIAEFPKLQDLFITSVQKNICEFRREIKK